MMGVRPARERYRFPIGSHRSTLAPGLRAVAWLLSLALSSCASPPPSVTPEVTYRQPTCPSCEEQTREIAELRQNLANREAELRDLRANQRDQVKVLQETTREAARAKMKLRRLATQ